MSGFQCPYCSMFMSIIHSTVTVMHPSFDGPHTAPTNSGTKYYPSQIELIFYKCPNCGEYTITAKGVGDRVTDIDTYLKPASPAKQFPDYIPIAIKNDYEEACAILNLSPKASATLARRCLQGMIRDYWNISKNTLFDEISALDGKIPADLWNAIDALRKLGNIGAHMEKDTNIIVDIDPDEAHKLIKLIELLMKEWYINRHERSELFADIIQTNEAKQQLRKNKE